VVVGIEPAVKPAAMQTRTGVVGILATSNTLASEKFRALVQGYAADKVVLTQPCPGLVEFVEQGELCGPQIEALLSRYIGALVGQGADVLVLGCTHYPFLASVIQRLAGDSIQVLDTGLAVARETQRRLAVAGELLSEPMDGSGAPPLQCYATGDTTALAFAIEQLLGLKVSVGKAAC
jgi:glutamate racemase